MMTRDIMPGNTISRVELVQHRQAVFVALSVVGLRFALAPSAGPVGVPGIDRLAVTPDELAVILSPPRGPDKLDLWGCRGAGAARRGQG